MPGDFFQWVSQSASSHGNAHSNSHSNGRCNAHKNHLKVVISIGQKYQNDIFPLSVENIPNSNRFLGSYDSFFDCYDYCYCDPYCEEADSVDHRKISHPRCNESILIAPLDHRYTRVGFNSTSVEL